MTTMLPSRLRESIVACRSPMLRSAIEEFCCGFIRFRMTMKKYPKIDFEIKVFTGGVSGGIAIELDYLLNLIQSQPGLRVAELVSQTGKPVRTIQRWLKQLKDSLRIEFRGAPKTGGYFLHDLGAGGVRLQNRVDSK